MVDIGDQQREEDVQLLDLFCQNGVLIDNAIYQLIGAQVLLTDLTDIEMCIRDRARGIAGTCRSCCHLPGRRSANL